MTKNPFVGGKMMFNKKRAGFPALFHLKI